MPDKKGWPAIAVYQDKIYMFGGDNQAIDRSMTTSAWVYDPQRDSYKDIASLPHPRSYCYAVTVGDYIHIFGARTLRSDGRADRSTFRYDPRRNTYTRTADLPEGARFIVHGSYNGCIYAVHGETNWETYADGVLKYDVAADKWTKLNLPRIEQQQVVSRASTRPTPPSARSCSSSAAGAAHGSGATGPAGSTWPRSFGEAASMPRGRCCGSAGVIEGKLYVTGGSGNGSTILQLQGDLGFPVPVDVG